MTSDLSSPLPVCWRFHIHTYFHPGYRFFEVKASRELGSVHLIRNEIECLRKLLHNDTVKTFSKGFILYLSSRWPESNNVIHELPILKISTINDFYDFEQLKQESSTKKSICAKKGSIRKKWVLVEEEEKNRPAVGVSIRRREQAQIKMRQKAAQQWSFSANYDFDCNFEEIYGSVSREFRWVKKNGINRWVFLYTCRQGV
jgi:hypothetical protein